MFQALRHPNLKRNRAVKTKDRKLPTIEEYYQLQLQPVVAEPYSQRRWNRSGAATARAGAVDFTTLDLTGDRTCKPTITVH
jgi:hypothetical protein